MSEKPIRWIFHKESETCGYNNEIAADILFDDYSINFVYIKRKGEEVVEEKLLGNYNKHSKEYDIKSVIPWANWVIEKFIKDQFKVELSIA